MKAIEYVEGLPRGWIPKGLPKKLDSGGQTMDASNSEIRRWLKEGSVVINGKKVAPGDEVEIPIRELVFFPTSKRKTTILQESVEAEI